MDPLAGLLFFTGMNGVISFYTAIPILESVHISRIKSVISDGT